MNQIDLDILALHIEAQNAGLVVRRLSDQYAFESFEVSATNEAVIGTKGRLRRCFPGPAIAVGQDRLADATFLEPLTDLLAKLDFEAPEEVCPTTKKAGSKVVEVRDTVHPRLVTEMLTGILRAVGKPLEVGRIHKHTRDDVLWHKTLKPWRRSPVWLILRVALQTSLFSRNERNPHRRYKTMMLVFLTYVLETAWRANLPSDILFIMTAKISRRMLKLEQADSNAWTNYIEKVTVTVQKGLTRKWEALEKNPDPQATQRNWIPSNLSFHDDTRLRISKLKLYLVKMRQRSALTSTTQAFTSNCQDRISPVSLILPQLSPVGFNSDKTHLNHIDLESWVCHSLDTWLHANIKSKDACMALGTLIDNYIRDASYFYTEEPEEISMVILTSMELWIALDKCALHQHPLLHKYDPEFPPTIFEPLLLPKKPQMERLSRVEKYLATRRQAAESGYPSIFRTHDSKESFAVQYFEQSLHHQQLRQEIERYAREERSKKLNELAERRRKYQVMLKESESMTCETFTSYRRGRPYTGHDRNCQKCDLKSRAEELSITIHEWPLPQQDLQAKAVVFELYVPVDFGQWRDTTFSLLVDLLTNKCDVPSRGRGGNTGGEMISLYSYSGLSGYSRSRAERVQLASSTKPFIVSHYNSMKVSRANETNIFVNNGLNYRLHEYNKHQWTDELLGRCNIRGKCTQKIPSGLYEKFQFAVDKTSHTSNEIIAGQSECPAVLTVHEHYAFGTLRAGHRLQWRNIARELAAYVLNFNCQEVHILVTQAAWQAGPSSDDICRESHIDLEEKEFGRSLLSVLSNAVHAIESNWQNVIAARTFVALTSRLLSLCACVDVRDGCFRLLRRARAVLLRWCRELTQNLQHGQEEEELARLSRRTLEIALTCYGTFDVDLSHLSSLITSDEDVADVTEVSVTIHDRCPAATDGLPPSIKILLRRHRRVACLLEPTLRERITKSPNGLNSTVARLWMGYKPGSSWEALGSPNERWLMTKTSKQSNISSVPVHYNLLDGTLLVNGSPLTRLPLTYEAHPTFRRIFGEVSKIRSFRHEFDQLMPQPENF